MSGRGRGRVYGRGHVRVRGNQPRGGNYYGTTNKRKIPCGALGESFFTYSKMRSEEQTQTTLRKIVKYTDTICG